MKLQEVGEVGEDGTYEAPNTEWIPCMRTSFLFGISTGIGVGLTHFLFTSKSIKSYQLSLCAYLVVTLGRYFQCRWDRSVRKFEAQKLQHSLTMLQALRGSDEDFDQLPEDDREFIEQMSKDQNE